MNLTNLPKLTPFLSSRKTRIGNPRKEKERNENYKNKYFFGVICPHKSLLQSKSLPYVTFAQINLPMSAFSSLVKHKLDFSYQEVAQRCKMENQL